MSKNKGRTRECAHCRRKFQPDPRVGEKHRYCPRPECRRTRQRLNQARWLEKNPDYHRGHTQRVADWRKENPGYRKSQAERRNLKRALGKVMSRELASALVTCGLQDLSERRLALILGIARRLSGPGLQTPMATTLRKLLLEGYAALGESDSPQD